MARPVLLAVCLAATAGLADAEPAPPGPGRGAWQVGIPEDFGMSSHLLSTGADEIAQLAAHRYCLVVVKDGTIIHETYYHNTSSSIYESDSLGKTITAAVIAAAVEAGLVNLDTPIEQLGVPSNLANWSVSGVDYFGEVTLRHLLAQSSGFGTVRPGTEMTYDSSAYIQHISYALGAALRGAKGAQWSSALDFASRQLAAALGLPDLYAYDKVGEDFSAGGGQMISCRDMARVSQLILNRGKWRDGAGEGYQLGSAKVMEQLLQPAFPGAVDGYGLLTWLNTNMSAPTEDGRPRSHCCGPRWVGREHSAKKCTASGTCGYCCEPANGYNLSRVPCEPGLPTVPDHCGEESSPQCANESDPSTYVSSTTLGESFPDADKPRRFPGMVGMGMGQFAKYTYLVPEKNLSVTTIGQSVGASLGCDSAYDDGFVLSLVWHALEPAIMAAKPAPPARQHPVRAEAPEGTPRPGGDRTWATLRRQAAAPRPTHDAAGEKITGSCVCACPPDQGFGKCFDSTYSGAAPAEGGACPASLLAKLPPASDFCPAVGQPAQCLAEHSGRDVCPIADSWVSGPMLHPCSRVPRTQQLATASCQYLAGRKWDWCTWQNSPCDFSPYFPP